MHPGIGDLHQTTPHPLLYARQRYTTNFIIRISISTFEHPISTLILYDDFDLMYFGE